MNNYTVVSFSGGKDSTAMLLHMIELGEHIDEVVNIDTGMEYPQMYEHINKIRQIVEKNGINFTVLKDDRSFEWWMLEKPIHSEKWGDHKGYGWPSINCRWCTRHLKLEPLRKHYSNLKMNYDLVQCVGLASDEFKRLARPNNTKPGQRHPLVEWGWSESDCLQYCHDNGFDWGGLYDIFNRVSCWCCPLASIGELRKLWKNFPELWQKLEEWEKIMEDPHIGRKFYFKDQITVFDLAKRFAHEERIAKMQTKLEEWQ